MAQRAWLEHQEFHGRPIHPQPAPSRPSILLVEDDDDTRELLLTLLGMCGFEISPCRSAEQGLEHLRHSPFDLVVTDYCLPRQTGGWLLKQAAAEGLLNATTALVVTAHPTPVDADGFEVMGKPFDGDVLVERIQQLIANDRLIDHHLTNPSLEFLGGRRES